MSWSVLKRILLIAAVCVCLSLSHGGINHADGDAHPDASNSTDISSETIGLGFGLSFMAAGFSSLGAVIPVIDLYILSRINPAWALVENKLFFAGTMAFAGGLLLTLSLWDLAPEAVEALADSGWFPSQHAGLVVVACILCGMLIIAFTSWLSGKLAPKGVKTCACDAVIGDQPVEPQKVVDIEVTEDCGCGCDPDVPPGECKCEVLEEPDSVAVLVDPKTKEADNNNESTNGKDIEKGDRDGDEEAERVNLYKFSLQMAAAIAIHNIPEGLATFVTIVKSTGVGVAFGIALCIHKIPEGIIISVPIWQATHSRVKTFLITLLIGLISQPLGAAIGYAVVTHTDYNQGAGGIVLSIVAGCMIYVSLKGMLPMARMYDPKDKCATICTMVGVIFMMTSSGLFRYSGLDA